jgi:hypothetical protein
MTLPDPPVDPTTLPPATIGSQPKNAGQVNDSVGLHLRQFLAAKAAVNQDQDWFAGTDLKAAPYYFTADQETQLKTAVSELDEALDAIDLTFVNRIVGMF